MAKIIYFLRFDGELLFHNDRTIDVRDIFDGTLQDVFNKLFNSKSSKALIDRLFDIEGECGEDVSAENPSQFLGCEIDDVKNATSTFMEYYKKRSYEEFFNDVDKTWQGRNVTSYSFVESDDLPKLITIIKTAAGKHHI